MQAGRTIFDRLYLCAVFDLDAKALHMFPQDGLGAPLRQAALKFIPGADAGEFRARDFPQTRAEQVNLSDADTGAKKRLDQPTPLDDFQCCRLERRAASLVVRRAPALYDPRRDAMTKEFAGRE
jgi:hypothetical protein